MMKVNKRMLDSQNIDCIITEITHKVDVYNEKKDERQRGNTMKSKESTKAKQNKCFACWLLGGASYKCKNAKWCINI